MDEVQIVLAIAVIYLIHRWWSKSPSSGSSRSSGAAAAGSSSTSTSTPASAAAERFNALAASIPNSTVQQAQSLFPQIDERQLKWEIVRTGRVRSLEAVAQDLLDEHYVLSTVSPTSLSLTYWSV